MSSRISRSLKSVGEVLRASAEDQIKGYAERFKALAGLYDAFVKKLLVTHFDWGDACRFAQSFFGSTEVPFAAIDGTQHVQSLFDLVVFFAGAYTCRGTITFHPDRPPTVNYAGGFTRGAAAISTVAPVYIPVVPEIDQQFFDPAEGEVLLDRPLSDQYIIDNSSISEVLMTFSEYFLAYRLAVSPTSKIKILLMDRTLAGQHSSLLYDTARHPHWKRKLSILGYPIDGQPVTLEDLIYCRHRIINSELELPPPRGDFLRYAILYLLERNRRALTLDQICQELGVDDPDRMERVSRLLERAVKEGFVSERRGHYKLKDNYRGSWRRITHLVLQVGNQLFSETLPKDPLASKNRLHILKGGRYSWLTTLDISFLTLFCLYMLIEECWRRRILLLGITKDTASRDFKRQLIPTLWHAKLLPKSSDRSILERAPNTDRMILQAISHLNASRLPVPWATIEYDAAFRTVVPDRHRPPRPNHVEGARRNRIALERAFLKSYIQLAAAESDPKLRSNVLHIDRIAYPGIDGTDPDSQVTFLHDYDGATEPVRLLLHRGDGKPNPVQNLTMTILRALTNPSIPECFGHNQPLMVADKIAKFHQQTFRNMIGSVTHWMSTHPHLRSFTLYMSTFRERRARIEATRRESRG